MRKKYFLIIISLLIIIPLQLAYLYLKDNNNGNVAGIKTYNNEVLNSVSIGDYRFTLFGYTSPFAEVTFSGQGIADQTTADEKGFFEFENRFSPFSPHEACLSAKDQFGRISSPVCLPPFPTQYNVTIGPVIMPPTISLDKNIYFIGDQVILTGQTIPDTDVNLSIFTQSSNNIISNIISKFQFPKLVEAFSLPKLLIKSDEKGNFSISLPSSTAQNFKLFTQAVFKNNQSPNSIFLKLKIEPIWMIILRFFLFLWLFLKSRLLETIIILEIIALLAYFFNICFHPYYLIPKKRSIVLYEEKLPEILEKYSIEKVKNIK
ncbi:MAG: hypothetical protein KatS3mg092_0470 [Patescibacteria group bacterium]|nr:MAG: hypothetical protein KatS3mg092_0470 [Patescibacteria group bacterium]